MSEQVSVTRHGSHVLHIVFEDRAWATFFVQDELGILSVVSDWGSWAYRWGRGPHLGVESNNLSDALRTRLDAHYVCDKLFGREREEYDERGTEHALLDRICKRRRGGHATKDDARAAWKAAGYIDFSHPELWVQAAYESHTLCDVLAAEPYEFTAQRKTFAYKFMLDKAVPAFIDALRQ